MNVILLLGTGSLPVLPQALSRGAVSPALGGAGEFPVARWVWGGEGSGVPELSRENQVRESLGKGNQER